MRLQVPSKIVGVEYKTLNVFAVDSWGRFVQDPRGNLIEHRPNSQYP